MMAHVGDGIGHGFKDGPSGREAGAYSVIGEADRESFGDERQVDWTSSRSRAVVVTIRIAQRRACPVKPGDRVGAPGRIDACSASA